MKDTEHKLGERLNVSSDVSDHDAPSASKRALLKSAWVAPVIVAVTLPRSGYAANVSGGGGRFNQSSQSKDSHSKDSHSQSKSNNGNHFGHFKKD